MPRPAIRLILPCLASLLNLAVGATDIAGTPADAEAATRSAGSADANDATSLSGAFPGTKQAVETLDTRRTELDDAHTLYTDAIATGQYPQALTQAQKLVAVTAEINGMDSVEYALAISALAAAQSKTDNLAGAAAGYKRSIDLIEEQKGIVAPQLIQPLMGLASVQNALGQWDRALENYGRALRLNHVEQGLNNLEQIPIRDGLTESYLGLGAMRDANFQQQIQLRIVRDEYPDDLGKLTDASGKLANWYGRTGQQESRVMQLEATVRTIREKSGADAVMQIDTLRELATAYQMLDLPQEEELNAYNAAIEALNEASRINDQQARPDPLLGAELQIAIGDVHTYYGSTRDARRSYTSAWQTLVAAQAGDEVLDRFFAAPTLVGPVRLPAVFPDDSATRKIWADTPGRFRPGTLQAIVDITDLGRTDNIRIIESTPEGLLDDRALYLLKRYRYRPRFTKGQPIATPDLPISHTFSYLPEVDNNEEASNVDSESDSSERLAYPEAAR